MRMLALMIVAPLALGCAQTTLFRAAEKATAISPAGNAAADYDLTVAGRDYGEAKVWSDGAYRQEIAGVDRTVLHVGFEIENHSEASFTLDMDRLWLDSTLAGRGSLRGKRANRIEGITEIPAGGTRRIDAYFFLPDTVEPDDVVAFRVRWALEDVGLGRRVYAERTPFLETPWPIYDGWPYGYPYGI